MVTFGTNPGQSVAVDGRLPRAADVPDDARPGLQDALDYMGVAAGRSDRRHEDRRGVHRVVHERPPVRPARGGGDRARADAWRAHVRALVVPGSRRVRDEAEREGLHEIFREAGFEWREAGCSMCLAMNPDRLNGREISASSSNRNFKGRQGSPTGRTLLMSPAMVAAAAVAGEVVDVRRVMAEEVS